MVKNGLITRVVLTFFFFMDPFKTEKNYGPLPIFKRKAGSVFSSCGHSVAIFGFNFDSKKEESKKMKLLKLGFQEQKVEFIPELGPDGKHKQEIISSPVSIRLGICTWTNFHILMKKFV